MKRHPGKGKTIEKWDFGVISSFPTAGSEEGTVLWPVVNNRTTELPTADNKTGETTLTGKIRAPGSISGTKNDELFIKRAKTAPRDEGNIGTNLQY